MGRTTVALYSVNPHVVFSICEEYREQRHVVWCGNVFDPSLEDPLSTLAMVPPSSCPSDIYKQWQKEARAAERHSPNRLRVRAKLTALASEWWTSGQISEDDRDEILFRVASNDHQLWMPLLYVIPRTESIRSRLERVPPADRAGLPLEYQLTLHRNEFDIIQF